MIIICVTKLNNYKYIINIIIFNVSLAGNTCANIMISNIEEFTTIKSFVAIEKSIKII